ncbi:Thiol-disulfide oxidoreductase ResA [Chryseobacterium sp. MOF25P]|uniref:TlpA family protein disulfide reductase n=1 Tax=unclassified Chryseobacterium TaxID=2593645 RepID=UPI000804B16B|nr:MULTISPECIES: redoxin domain-containing protein [unclassified Chryseobacterium]OBW39525.1 Thiol-disulfide oxidoreductase ResA [Chryseobacterium sp. MOF25P]OBW44213.1 Thiol-disulfide oxidoreductase ResA [Chryseobacterium sp. BGARF1]
MKYFLFIFLSVFCSIYLHSQVPDLERAKRKYFQANVISYKTTAYYPNPETDATSVLNIFHTIYKPQNKDFEFYSKNETAEEFYKNNFYYEVDHREKTIYEYENKDNQNSAISSSRLRQFGPTTLLKMKWSYIDDTQIDGKIHSHYSNIESIHHYEGKEIKVEYHIYISGNFTISKLERKSFVDGKLGQTVTYLFSNYIFYDKTTNFKVILPKDYALKYYERQDSLKPLTKNTEVLSFKAVDITGKHISFSSKKEKQTLLLFSSTNCGYSKIISDHILSPGFRLNSQTELINIFGSDPKINATKYFVNKEVKFPVISDRKDLEKQFGINGYPILYLIDENGIIKETLDGSSQILPFLKSLTGK